MSYAGIEIAHAHENVGLYDTVLDEQEYKKIYIHQQTSLV